MWKEYLAEYVIALAIIVFTYSVFKGLDALISILESMYELLHPEDETQVNPQIENDMRNNKEGKV